MLILLPPSEGKRMPASGAPLDLDALSHPELTGARRSALDALVATSRQPDAAARLGVPAGALDQVRANVDLPSAPAAPAADVYSGVLYEALALDTLPDGARSCAAASVRVFSALFGVLSPDDRVPAYRLSACGRLDGLGTAKAHWRTALRGLPLYDDLVIDCRSGDYASFWRPAGALGVRVFSERDGRRTVVSHWAKQARGHVARALLLADTPPRDAAGAVAAVNDHLAASPPTTAAGLPLRLVAEPGEGALDIVVHTG